MYLIYSGYIYYKLSFSIILFMLFLFSLLLRSHVDSLNIYDFNFFLHFTT